MSEGSPAVLLRGVYKTFEEGRVQALRGVDLEIARGEWIAVTGPSGSGKTTLLNIIGAMDVPTSGEVLLDGLRLADESSLEQARRTRIGFIFQMHNLIPVLNPVENVEIAMLPRRIPKRERRAKALALLEAVGLSERATADVRVLSGGERQRVAVARALANDPIVLLADEPTGNLDSETGRQVMETIHGVRRRRGAALVLVTHNEEICEGADRRFRLRDGILEEMRVVRAAPRADRVTP